MTDTKKIEDGGPAFPLIIKEVDPNSYPAPSYHEKQFFGLSVRDYFAGQALAAFGAAFLAGGWHHPNDYQIGVMVDGAYRAADAMIEARKAGEA